MNACIWLLVALLASSEPGAADQPNPGGLDVTTGEAALHYLDIAHPSVSQCIDPITEGTRGATFVQVDVAEVANPGKYGLSFDVYYQPTGGEKIRLGTFSLFPADNPGKFIVPTQGKVNREGSIVVFMLVTDTVADGVPLKVGIGRIALVMGRQST